MRILIFLFLSITAFGQDYVSIIKKSAAITDVRLTRDVTTDILLRPADWNISASKYAVMPGDRLIMSGDRKEIEFHNLQGTAARPIIITSLTKILIGAVNPGGRVVTCYNCQYVRLTGDPDGTGSSNIVINGGGQGVDFRDLSQHVEADHLDITTGYSGINVKTDPSCDPRTWRGNFVLDGVYLHHNRISTKTGEAFYINESHYHSVGAIQGGPCASGATTAQEHEGRNVIIEYNVITTSGADGIQVGAVPDGSCTIRYNEVYKYGTANGYGQTAGIILNPGTIADVYGNKIDTGNGFAIQDQGPGGSKIHDNLIINPGMGGVFSAVYAIAGFTSTAATQIYNNTIVNAKGSALEYYSPVTFKNNIFQLASGAVAYKKGGSAGLLTESGNKQLSGITGMLDASYAPVVGAVPAGVGYKPLPTITKESGGTVELVTENGIDSYWLVMPSGKRKKIE